jgi:CRP-like cAMP-binding protein
VEAARPAAEEPGEGWTVLQALPQWAVRTLEVILISPLIDKLSRRDFISDEEKAVLADVVAPPVTLKAGDNIVEQYDRPSRSTLLLEGFAARYVVLMNGARQITELNVPGDFVDLHSLLMSPMDHGVICLTDCKVGYCPHEALRFISQTQPHLTRLLWLETLIDAAVHRQWLAGLGRRTAFARFAHFLCEVYLRLASVERAEGHRMVLPLSQAILADVLGLSAVHVNRSVAQLRADGLVEWRGRNIRILDWDRLVRVAEFDPTYLRLGRDPV